MTATMMVIRNRSDVYASWDKKTVVIREQAQGSAIVYPQLGRGVTYHGFDLRESYVLAGLRDIREGMLWCNHHYYRWSVMGHPELKCP